MEVYRNYIRSVPNFVAEQRIRENLPFLNITELLKISENLGENISPEIRTMVSARRDYLMSYQPVFNELAPLRSKLTDAVDRGRNEVTKNPELVQEVREVMRTELEPALKRAPEGSIEREQLLRWREDLTELMAGRKPKS